MKKTPFYTQVYFSNRFYLLGLSVVVIFVLLWLLNWPLVVGQWYFLMALALVFIDGFYLFFPQHKFTCSRLLSNRFSNSDANLVSLTLWHSYPLPLRVDLIEELPEQFQARNNRITRQYSRNKKHVLNYYLRPVQRGDYHFGYSICMLSSPLRLLQRRRLGSTPVTVKVYPSFLQLRQFQLMAQTVHTKEQGTKQLRKIGHSLEFDHIKEYVYGDDVRAVNWKATARQAGLMVNSFVDERSQQVYCIIDKGRLMKMPFKGLSLMDYAINSTLVLSNVALIRQDRAGLVTFSHKAGDFVGADRKAGQLKIMQEALYRIQTEFYESDFEKLYLQVRTQIKQRSLIVLFTNFESTSGMRRQLPFLRQMARHHLLLVVFFENTELAELAHRKAASLQEVYNNTIASKFVLEKKMMVKELMHHGIMALLTPPEQLTVHAVNKYIELKTRQAV